MSPSRLAQTRRLGLALPFLIVPLLVLGVVLGACSPEEPAEQPTEHDWGTLRRVDEKLEPGKGKLKVGVTDRIIDGPVGTSMAGYGGRGGGRQSHWSDQLKGTAGFYGMQSVKIVALEVGDERIAFVKSPLMSSESYITDAIARHLKETHKLDFTGKVITMAGHSHHTTARYWPLPELLGHVGADTFDAEVAEKAAAIFADGIAEAWNKREDGEWAYGWTEDWDPEHQVYRDRRGHSGFGKDPRLSMMAFRKKDGTPLAAIMNFPIHGTVFDSDNDLFTEDAPGYVEHKFEELFYATKGKPIYGMLAQASGGSTSPGGDKLGHPKLARLERIGESAAPAILKLYDSLEWSDTTELAVRTQRMELIHERIYEGRPWEDEFNDDEGSPYTYGAWMCTPRDGSMKGQPKYCIDLGYFLDLVESAVPHDAAHQAIITTARLGDVWMITMPGEPHWSLVQYAREQASKRKWKNKPMELMVIGYSQDHLLYLAAPEDWYLGGYEIEMNLWGPGGGIFLMDEGLAMVDAMAEGYNGPAFYEDSPALSPVGVYEPRPTELAIDAGEIIEQPAAEAVRTDTLRFAANCGDPGLGNPYLKVQLKDQNSGKFVDLPAANGWKGKVYDNSRYEMVSVYLPDPPVRKHESVEKRQHLWQFHWQVPADWPAGTYRFNLKCKAVSKKGDKPTQLDLNSEPFTVSMPERSHVEAWSEDNKFYLRLFTPAVENETTTASRPQVGTWISSGYRLLDGDQCHNRAALVREALRVQILDADLNLVGNSFDITYDAKARAHVIDFGDALPEDGSVRVWLASDHDPSVLMGPLLDNPSPLTLPASRADCERKHCSHDVTDTVWLESSANAENESGIDLARQWVDSCIDAYADENADTSECKAKVAPEKLKLSSSCFNCFGEQASCIAAMTKSCASECVAEGEACDTCQNKHRQDCNSAFNTCSGLTIIDR